MGYVGQAPGAAPVTSSDITDGTIINADIASDAAIALSKTALSAGTGITLSTNTLNVDAAQTGITSVGALNAGSITSGFTSIDVGAGAISTTGVITGGGLTVGSAVLIEAELEMIDGITAGTAAASKAVVLDGSKNIATIGTIGSGAITATGTSSFATAIRTPLIEFTDGDDAITIVDGGGVTFAGDIKLAATKKLFLDSANTYLYEESSNDVHQVVGGVVMQEWDSDTSRVMFNNSDVTIGNNRGLLIGGDNLNQETVSIGDSDTDLVPELQVLGTAAADASILLASFNTTATTAGSPVLAFAKSGHGTIGSHTVVTDGEELGNIIAFGDDSNDLETPAASIQFEVDGTASADNMPGRIIFNTTAAGAAAVTERIRIDKTGAIGIAGANYGTDGQILTSGGAGAAVAWEDAGGGTFDSLYKAVIEGNAAAGGIKAWVMVSPPNGNPADGDVLDGASVVADGYGSRGTDNYSTLRGGGWRFSDHSSNSADSDHGISGDWLGHNDTTGGVMVARIVWPHHADVSGACFARKNTGTSGADENNFQGFRKITTGNVFAVCDSGGTETTRDTSTTGVLQVGYRVEQFWESGAKVMRFYAGGSQVGADVTTNTHATSMDWFIGFRSDETTTNACVMNMSDITTWRKENV